MLNHPHAHFGAWLLGTVSQKVQGGKTTNVAISNLQIQKLTRVLVSGSEFSIILVSRLGKDSNGELLQVANMQFQIFRDDTIVWQVACELLKKKTLRYGLEHSIGNPHTEFGFIPMNTDEGV